MRAVSTPVGRCRIRSFAAPNRIGPAAQDRGDELVDDRVGIGRDLVDEPDAQRCLGVETLAGQEVAPRVRADLGQHERRDDGRDDPEPHLREAENGVGGGDRDVGARDQPAPAAERVAVYARDHRSGAGVDRLAHLVQAHRVLDVLVVGEVDRRALPLDVGAGAEGGAFAGEDDGARVADQR